MEYVFMHQNILKVRRKFLSQAINYTVGEKIVSGRVAADIYAQILGFDNNNTLNYLLGQNDFRARMLVENDWNYNNQRAFKVISQHIPNLTSSMLYAIEQMSKPWYTNDLEWRPTLISLLKGVEHVEYLRFRNKYDLCDGLSYLFIYLASDQAYNNKAKNRIYMICCLLSDLIESGRISAIRWSDIAALYNEEHFDLMVEWVLHSREKRIRDIELLERFENYAFKDFSNFSTNSIGVEPFQNLFRELGVDIDNLCLPHYLEIDWV